MRMVPKRFSAIDLLLPSRSYMTTTFMIEAMAAANAQLRWKRREQEEVSHVGGGRAQPGGWLGGGDQPR